MTYARPEILVLGNAVRVIEDTQSMKPHVNFFDGTGKPRRESAAYDLDE